MMEVTAASESTPGRATNEDHFFVVSDLVGVLDGVSVPPGLETGCRHGPAWYVRALAGALVAAHRGERRTSLPAILEKAIAAVRLSHVETCDLDHPGTPASTVSLLRVLPDRAEYLVLCDSPIVLELGAEVRVIVDDRFEAAVAPLRAAALAGSAAIGTLDHHSRIRDMVRAQRQQINRDGGYWVASAEPRAAQHALTGVVPLTGDGALRRAALLTDGASCAVEQFQLFDWRGLLDLMTLPRGPRQLIAQVRAAERADSDGFARPRYKRHDDATAVLCQFV